MSCSIALLKMEALKESAARALSFVHPTSGNASASVAAETHRSCSVMEVVVSRKRGPQYRP